MKKILLMLLCVSVLGCSKNSVESEKPVDVLLIGGGIMSATLGTYLNELEPGWTIEMVERLDKVAEESSNGWNNAGTGHSAFCELNYTSEAADGSMDISKAVAINENFEISKQFWAYQVDRKVLNDPKSFINNVPHMSFVWGDDNVAFLKKRHAVCAQAELEELAWLVPGQAQPDNLAPLLRDHVLPALARRAAENPETQAEHRTRPDHVR